MDKGKSTTNAVTQKSLQSCPAGAVQVCCSVFGTEHPVLHCLILFALQDHLLTATVAVPADEWGVLSHQFSTSARLKSVSLIWASHKTDLDMYGTSLIRCFAYNVDMP